MPEPRSPVRRNPLPFVIGPAMTLGIAHRHQREQEIVAVLRNGDAGPMEIVKVVYANYPEALHPAACQSVTQHLLKLEREGRARHDGKDPILSVWSLC